MFDYFNYPVCRCHSTPDTRYHLFSLPRVNKGINYIKLFIDIYYSKLL